MRRTILTILKKPKIKDVILNGKVKKDSKKKKDLLF